MLAAGALLLATAGVGWLLSDPVAGAPATPAAQRPVLGLPFRVLESAWTQVTFSPTADEGGARTLHPVLEDAESVIKYLAIRGFSDVTELRRRGETFICEATGPRRQRVRLVVDARSGEISGMRVIGYAEPRP